MAFGSARDFARALFAVACEHKIENQVCLELHEAASSVAGLDKLRDFLLCPAFAVSEKTELVARAFHGSRLFKNFLDLCVRRKAFGLLPSIAAEYKKVLDSAKGRAPVRVFSAHPLDEPSRSLLESKLKKMFGRKPEASYEVDGSLLAGLLIKYEDKVIDASLSRQLK